ncbi:M55 family metallopeptidase [Brucella anthropi]
MTTPARAMLREGAIRAVREAGSKKAFRLNGPYKTEFLMSNAALADQMAILPPARRVDAVTVGFDCVTMAEVVGWMTALSAMSFALR